MGDLISRKALIAEYDRVHIGPPGGARKLMEDAPTVDAVEVVRCKDCVHYINLLENGSDYRCSVFNGCYDRPYPTEADDFCSYGERREGE